MTVPGTAPLPSWALEESAEELYEDAPCGYLSTAADGTVVRINRTLLGWLGERHEDVVGTRRFADLLAPGPRVVWLTHQVPQLATGGRVTGVLLELVRADGGTLPVLVGARLVEAEPGVPAVVRVTVLDASERRAYESSLRAARRTAERVELRARALQQVTSACAASTTTDELVGAVVEVVGAAWHPLGCVLRLGDGPQSLSDVARYGSPPPASVPSAQVWRDRSVEVRRLVAADAAHAGWTGGTAVDVPVHHAGRALGVLCLLLGPAAAPEAEDASVLETLGELVGMALTRTRMYEALQRLALHDELTGLANRVSLAEMLAQAISHADRTGQPLAVMVIDLDGFKQVNDTLGHAAGDELLAVTADRLRETVRDSDRLARLGGDEFVVVGEDTDEVAAATVAARVAGRLAEPVQLTGGTVEVSASVGIAVRAPGSGIAADVLVARADAAMYDEKRHARAGRPAR